MTSRSEYLKLHYRNNKHLYVEKQKRYYRKNPAAYMISSARKRGLEIDISKGDIVVPEYCPILGTKLAEVWQPRGSDPATIPSLDRIDSSVGYVKGNVRVISLLANMMKSSATRDQLLKFADSIIKGIV